MTYLTKPTPRQRDILTALAAYLETHGQTAPSLRELGELTDTASTACVSYHIKNLVRQGMIAVQHLDGIESNPIVSRSYRPTPQGYDLLARLRVRKNGSGGQ